MGDELKKHQEFANMTNATSLDDPDIVTPELLALAGTPPSSGSAQGSGSAKAKKKDSEDKVLGLELHYFVLAIVGVATMLAFVAYFVFGRSKTETVHSSAKVIDVVPASASPSQSVRMSQFPKQEVKPQEEEWQ